MKFGFINKLGNEVIEPCFDDASEFHNHYAGVLLKNKWGVIDDNLNFVINPKIRCNNLFVVSYYVQVFYKEGNNYKIYHMFQLMSIAQGPHVL